MAEFAKVGTPSVCTVLPNAGERIGTFRCLEAIAAGDLCRVVAGGIRKSSGAANDTTAAVHGVAGTSGAIGEADVVLWTGVNFQYQGKGTDLGGKNFYASATVPGGLSDTPTTGGVEICGFGLPDGRIRFRSVLK